MMAELINIWYPLRKSRFHILVWKSLWNISLERKLCGYFWSSVHSLRSPGWMHETCARTWCNGKTRREQVEREVGGGPGWGTHVNPRLFHFNVWQNPLQIKKIKIKKIKRRRLYKLNCLQILKTTNKISVGEEIYFLVLDKKHLEKHELWSPHSHSKKGGGQRRNPLTHHIYFWFRWKGKYLVLHIRKERCSLKTLTTSFHSSPIWGLHHMWPQDQERQMWPGHGDRARLMSRAGQWDFWNTWR